MKMEPILFIVFLILIASLFYFLGYTEARTAYEPKEKLYTFDEMSKICIAQTQKTFGITDEDLKKYNEKNDFKEDKK